MSGQQCGVNVKGHMLLNPAGINPSQYTSPEMTDGNPTVWFYK